MRKPPDKTTPPPRDRKADPGRIVMKREYRLLTPLFGGGVEAGKIDETFPIRGATIRGQLRFWWRATRGGRFGREGLADMKAAEGRLWGSTETGSLVTVDVSRSFAGKALQLPNNKKGEVVHVGDPESKYGYVAFPLRESKGAVYEGVSFDLILSVPANKADIEDIQAALWAWETFGGVGARTRRGFGALYCTRVSPQPGSAVFNSADWRWEYDSKSVADAMQVHVKRFVTGSDSPQDNKYPKGVPHLSRLDGRYAITSPRNDAMAVWKYLIDGLRNYRQNRNGKYGRSNWPEPDAVRRLTGQSLKSLDHDTPIHDPLIDRFPRADFGLPILFGFHPDHKPKERDLMNPDRDPRDTTLQGIEHDRLASPLILRPLACSDGKAVGLALILETQRIPPGGLILKGSALNARVKSTLTPDQASQITEKHSWSRIGVDVLQSFLEGLKKEES